MVLFASYTNGQGSGILGFFFALTGIVELPSKVPNVIPLANPPLNMMPSAANSNPPQLNGFPLKLTPAQAEQLSKMPRDQQMAFLARENQHQKLQQQQQRTQFVQQQQKLQQMSAPSVAQAGPSAQQFNPMSLQASGSNNFPPGAAGLSAALNIQRMQELIKNNVNILQQNMMNAANMQELINNNVNILQQYMMNAVNMHRQTVMAAGGSMPHNMGNPMGQSSLPTRAFTGSS
jgi:hypothetical protein